MIVMIDAGHGITTPGKRSPIEYGWPQGGRLREYKYCREIAQAVVSALRSQGIDAQLVTPEDADVALGQRCNRVNAVCDRVGAANVLLVSIHNNAAGNGPWMSARGWEAWTSKGQTRGDKLAECLYNAARAILPKGTPIRTDTTDGDSDKESNFTILYRTRCAACLTENLFQDNKADVDYLLSKEGRDAIVQLHVKGITDYIKSI